jgi:hypothetical protein
MGPHVTILYTHIHTYICIYKRSEAVTATAHYKAFSCDRPCRYGVGACALRVGNTPSVSTHRPLRGPSWDWRELCIDCRQSETTETNSTWTRLIARGGYNGYNIASRITNSKELTPWNAASHTGTQEFAKMLWNPKCITVFTRALHWSLSWARLIKFIPRHPVTLRSISILSSHLYLGLPRRLFPSGLPTKSPIFIPLLPMSTTYSAYLILLDFILQ